jgi:hypothetical protein
MPENILILMTASALCFSLAVAIRLAAGRKAMADGLANILADIFAWAGLIFLVSAAMCGWMETRRLPVYGRLETNLHVGLILAICVELAGRRPHLSDVQPWGRTVVCALIVVALFTHDGLNPNFYMYQFLSVQLFFFLRLSAGGVLIFAFLLFASTWIRLLVSSENEKQGAIRAAATALILGAVLFLGAEFSGTLWSSLSYGDTWHWSRNFFRSSAVFLLLMLPLHAPASFRKNVRAAGLGTLCTAAVILEIVL